MLFYSCLKKFFILFLVFLSFSCFSAEKNQYFFEQNKEHVNSSQNFSVNFSTNEKPDDFVSAVKIVAVLTLVVFGPVLLLLMSSFTRILIVLSFLRQAIGMPTMPPNQILISISLFLTYFIMSPTITKIYDSSVLPYMNKEITTTQAIELGKKPLHDFMISQVKGKDLLLFYQMSHIESPKKKDDIPMRILVPAFVFSELKIAFQIGFLIYVPFIAIDLIVSSVLMAMGMMMLPPTVLSLPLKIVLFVIADGWNLVAGSLIKSFH